jgi:hypothetical protein
MIAAQTKLLVPNTLPKSLEAENSIPKVVIPDTNTAK